MTGDARGEAERIVDRLVNTEVEQATEPSSIAAHWADVYRYDVVAALAAAIEATELRSESGIDAALGDLRDALAALRARAGEEAG